MPMQVVATSQRRCFIVSTMPKPALTLPPGPERTALYKKMVDVVVEDCPWIFGVHRVQYDLTQPWLKNFRYNEVDHGMLKYLRVDPTAKK